MDDPLQKVPYDGNGGEADDHGVVPARKGKKERERGRGKREGGREEREREGGREEREREREERERGKGMARA